MKPPNKPASTLECKRSYLKFAGLSVLQVPLISHHLHSAKDEAWILAFILSTVLSIKCCCLKKSTHQNYRQQSEIITTTVATILIATKWTAPDKVLLGLQTDETELGSSSWHQTSSSKHLWSRSHLAKQTQLGDPPATNIHCQNQAGSKQKYCVLTQVWHTELDPHATFLKDLQGSYPLSSATCITNASKDVDKNFSITHERLEARWLRNPDHWYRFRGSESRLGVQARFSACWICWAKQIQQGSCAWSAGMPI